jgi:hypothetical protein
MVEWVDELPQPKLWPNQKHDWASIAADLRRDPGRWALVARDVPHSHSYAIRQGLKRDFQPPEDWLTRTVSDPETRTARHRTNLYMAFIGAPGARLRAMRELEHRSDE